MEIFTPKTSEILHCSTETYETIGTLETLFTPKNALKSTKKGIITTQFSPFLAQKQPILTQKALKKERFHPFLADFLWKITGFTAIRPGFCSKVKQLTNGKLSPVDATDIQ